MPDLPSGNRARKSKLDFVKVSTRLLYKLTPTEFMVHSAFKSFAGLKTGKTIVSVQTIAQVTRLHPDTIKLALRSLSKAGLITSKRRGLNKTSERTVLDGEDFPLSDGEKNTPQKEKQIEERCLPENDHTANKRSYRVMLGQKTLA